MTVEFPVAWLLGLKATFLEVALEPEGVVIRIDEGDGPPPENDEQRLEIRGEVRDGRAIFNFDAPLAAGRSHAAVEDAKAVLRTLTTAHVRSDAGIQPFVEVPFGGSDWAKSLAGSLGEELVRWRRSEGILPGAPTPPLEPCGCLVPPGEGD